MRLAALFLVACAAPGFAQLELVLADGTPVPSTYDLGQTYAGEPVAVYFRLHNRSATAASLTSLGISGHIRLHGDLPGERHGELQRGAARGHDRSAADGNGGAESHLPGG